MNDFHDIVNMSATELVTQMRSRKISALEVMKAHLAQIDIVNPKVNAIVTLDEERALAGAKLADEAIANGELLGLLHGLPTAHKDLVPTKGIRTTYGSLIYKDFIPDFNSLIVDRIQGAGAITIGKTNTPEFGAGSQTFNEVFGATLNPYNLNMTCGGSSGGAAVSLASRMLPIADGSDTGGSLRNPANYCNVVGFRPSPGRVPSYPNKVGWSPTSVQGPMARNVSDCALLLSAMSGPDSRVPISLTDDGSVFSQSLDRDFNNINIAWSPTLGGLPVEQDVLKTLESQLGIFEEIGCHINQADPDFTDANEVFLRWRGWERVINQGDLLEKHRDTLKDSMIWDIEQGLKLSASDVAWAETKRIEIFRRMENFMKKYNFLICPVSQSPPFDINQPWVKEINGVQMDNYIDWMRSCYYITVTGHPAISVPCGFTEQGLPVGIQIVGRYRDDLGVLQLAKAFESATEFWKTVPDISK